MQVEAGAHLSSSFALLCLFRYLFIENSANYVATYNSILLRATLLAGTGKAISV